MTALYINTIAAGPPALALGLEPTDSDAMERSPGDYRTIFTRACAYHQAVKFPRSSSASPSAVYWWLECVISGPSLPRFAKANFYSIILLLRSLFFYGVLAGALAIANFTIVVYGSSLTPKGDLGFDCNEGGYDSRCINVYHGRATAFATLMSVLMVRCSSPAPSLWPPG